MANKNRVFVYGTLKQGNRTRGMQHFGGEAEFIGDATTDADFSMYNLGSFPAAVLNGEHKISGQVFDVDDDVLEVLDHIEGYPDFYSRDQINTSLGKAWIYHIKDIDEYHGEKIVPSDGNTVSWLR